MAKKKRTTKKSAQRNSKPTREPHYRAKPSKEGYLGSVHIAGQEIEVHRRAGIVMDGDLQADGVYYPAFDKIELEAHLSPAAELRTFIHELWHAIRDKYEIPLSHDHEEALAGPIGNGFAQALEHWLPKRGLKPWAKGEE